MNATFNKTKTFWWLFWSEFPYYTSSLKQKRYVFYVNFQEESKTHLRWCLVWVLFQNVHRKVKSPLNVHLQDMSVVDVTAIKRQEQSFDWLWNKELDLHAIITNWHRANTSYMWPTDAREVHTSYHSFNCKTYASYTYMWYWETARRGFRTRRYPKWGSSK